MADCAKRALASIAAEAGIAVVRLTRGLVSIVDAEDAESVNRWSWSAAGSTKFYANRHDGKRSVYLHRELLGAGTGQQVDHINGDSLDNRRVNLRLCTVSQNAANRKVCLGASGYKGVKAKRGAWQARVSLKSGQILLGTFPTAEEAARAYDRKLVELFGEFAQTNFPLTGEPPKTLRQQANENAMCPVCGVHIEVKPLGRLRRFCSRRCADRNRRRRT